MIIKILSAIFCKARSLLIAVSFFLINEIQVIAQQKSKSIIDDLLLVATQQVNKGNLDSALFYQDKALSLPHSLYEEGVIRLAIANTYYKKSELEKTLQHSKRVLAIGQQLQNKYLISSAHNELGLYYLDKSMYEEASDHFEKAVAKLDSGILKADILNNLAYLSDQANKKVEAIDYYFQALKIYKSQGKSENEAKTLSNVGSIFHSMGKLEEAIRYFQESIQIRESINDIIGLPTAYNNIAQMYMLKKDFVSAEKYMQLGRQYAEKVGNSRLIASIYQGIATLNRRLGKLDEAWIWQTKAIGMFEEQNQTEILSRVYLAAGSLAAERKDTTNANNYFARAVSMAQNIKSHQNLSMAYNQMADYYKQQQNFEKAFYYFQQYIAYKDSIQNREVITKIAEIEQQYQTARKDNEIAKLQADQLNKQLTLTKQEQHIIELAQAEQLQAVRIKHQEEELLRKETQNALMEQEHQLMVQKNLINEQELQQQKIWRVIILICVLMITFTAYSYFNRFRLRKKIEHQEMLLRERNRIARDLHDEVGSTLCAINILSHTAKDRFNKHPEKVGRQLELISDNAQTMLETMNDIVWSINPFNDDLEKILLRMREYANSVLEPRNIQFELEVSEVLAAIKLSPEIRRNLYLIFKEAVNNSSKYSHATALNIRFFGVNQVLFLCIEDNGVGFDIQRISSGNGLRNMQRRALQSEGKISIESIKNKGTKILLELPYT